VAIATVGKLIRHLHDLQTERRLSQLQPVSA
jgi:hypothetical protein